MDAKSQKSLMELAKLFKDRDNIPQVGIQIGEVVSVSPLQISVGSSLLLDKENLIIAASLLSGYTRNTEFHQTSPVISTLSGSLNWSSNLFAMGDEVILIPSVDLQTWYVMDKGVRL
jgi:hypothetical protein